MLWEWLLLGLAVNFHSMSALVGLLIAYYNRNRVTTSHRQPSGELRDNRVWM